MTENNHNTIMKNLINEHNKLLDIFQGRNILFTDIPVYNNIGDLLIMFGTMKFFEKNCIKLKSITSAYDFDFSKVEKSDVIVLQGGGNFGDLYHLHQKFRDEVIRKFPNNKIVVLPQTIYFESQENYEKCCEQYSKHKDLHICVRDESSFDLASKMSNNVYLLPDMAHNLYPLSSKSELKYNTLFIKRIDKELSSFRLDIMSDKQTDWEELLSFHNFFIKIIRKQFKINFLDKLLIKLWIWYSDILVDKAIKLFSGYEKIYTTRLHGHILACLMDKKNIVFDNSYGKNSSYMKLWTSKSEIVEIAKESVKDE